MAHSSGNTIFEEREALMVSPTGRIPTLRTAHFIKPTANSIASPNLKLPFLPLCSETTWPLSVSFNGWYDFLKKWPTWVNNMKLKYEVVWKRSGIYDAILGSTYRIRRNSELIFGVAERWCSETSSFLFPWGEATITLEDMMVLGGFSVLGNPFFMPLEAKELIEIENGLKKLVKTMAKSKKRDVGQCEWIDYFMNSGDDLEHEAFLSLWLSRFVLPSNVFDAINVDNFSVAIYLARGIRIALAPVVLASLYRDLRLLKEAILFTHEVNVDENVCNNVEITLWSPIQFVQIWAWERLPALQPKPKAISRGEPRLARWHGGNWLKRLNLRLLIDSAGESFLWRPYAIAADNWFIPGFYKDEEGWVLTDGSLSEELESFARCLRVAELVGTESIEAYLPHRVAMQFGMDQDLPQWNPKSNETHELAWENFIRPVYDVKLYFPNRHFEADVTKRYMEWWEKSVLDLQGEIKGLLRGIRSSRIDGPRGLPRKRIWGKRISQIWNKSSILKMQGIEDRHSPAVKDNCLTSLKEGTDPDTPPGFPPKCVKEKERLRTSSKSAILDSSYIDTKPLLAFEENGFTTSIQSNDPDVPPGFPPKCDKQSIQNRLDIDVKPFVAVEARSLPPLIEGNSEDFPPGTPPTCNQVNEMAQICNRHSCKSRPIYKDKPVVASKKQRLCSSTEDNGAVSRMMRNLSESIEMVKQSEATTRPSEPDGRIAYSSKKKSESSIQNGGGIDHGEGSNFLKKKLEQNIFTTSIAGNDSEVRPCFPAICNKQSIENRLDADVKPFVAVENHRLPSLTEDHSHPPGFTPQHNQVNRMAQTSWESRLIDDNNPVMASKKQHLCSSTQDNGEVSRMTENLSKPMVIAKQSEATIRSSEPAGKNANNHETKSESSIRNRGGINCNERNIFFLKTKLEHFDIETHIRLHESVLARLKAARSEYSYKCVKQEPDS